MDISVSFSFFSPAASRFIADEELDLAAWSKDNEANSHSGEGCVKQPRARVITPTMDCDEKDGWPSKTTGCS
ncbi:unnamed protein product [Cuscuta campestris]|uniref:Uncharacterized protein n=2 Tax=Cuscuta sect. Cleistogrammica TaxID=1824901 RepID=A0A484NHN4_9ASTE|nr:hypothetical protein DM860_015960 [Cuscuta australis]VFR00896.1 unnamed protein product [Cuscuta campestris]